MKTLFAAYGFEVTLELVLALSGGLFALYQAMVTRRQHRLSVKPLLRWDNDKTWMAGGVGLVLAFKFKNHGLGPAIFSNVKITLSSETFDMSVDDPVEQLVSAILGKAFDYNIVQSTTIPRGMVVPSQQEIQVVEIHLPEVRKDCQKEFMALFDRVELKVDYRSMYGKRFVFETADKGPPHFLKKLWHCTKTFFAWLF